MLDIAKGKAKEIISSYSDQDKVQILTNDFGFNENKFLSKNEALRFLSTLQISPKNKRPLSILEKQKQLLSTKSKLFLSPIFKKTISLRI